MNRHQIDYALHAEQRREDARIKRLEQKQELEQAREIVKERLNVKTPEEPEEPKKERDDDVTIVKTEDVITDDEQGGVTTTTAQQQTRPEDAEMISAKEEKEGKRIPIEIDAIGALRGIIEIKDQEIRKLQKQKGVIAEKEFTTEVSIPLIDIVAQAQGISKTGYTSKAKKEFEKRMVVVNILIDLDTKTVEYLDLKMVEKK